MKTRTKNIESAPEDLTNVHAHPVLIGLSAAIVSVADYCPRVLAVHRMGHADALPFGPFDPLSHRTLESGLRTWVSEQTYLQLGYVEQLYTFGDRGRHLLRPDEGQRVVSVGYLALTRPQGELKAPGTLWRDWYGYFPWEDWRVSRPAMIDHIVKPRLLAFATAAPDDATRARRRERMQLCFGFGDLAWDEEKVLERYELLYEAGLVPEAARDGRPGAEPVAALGEPMAFDHRRILATAMGRLRAKMKYRPVVFELMPAEFTLLELQLTVEAITGIRLHKQNFRRLVGEPGAGGRHRQSFRQSGREAGQRVPLPPRCAARAPRPRPAAKGP